MTQLQRWMVSGPEIARVINEFESAQERIKKDQSKGPDLRHHEQVKSRQDTFARQVKAFCSVLEEMGNPFMEQSDDLLILDTRDIVDPRVAETVRNYMFPVKFEMFGELRSWMTNRYDPDEGK
ncbi:Hypothetical predicted protein, partial [Mytilus galloprovincialis]